MRRTTFRSSCHAFTAAITKSSRNSYSQSLHNIIVGTSYLGNHCRHDYLTLCASQVIQSDDSTLILHQPAQISTWGRPGSSPLLTCLWLTVSSLRPLDQRTDHCATTQNKSTNALHVRTLTKNNLQNNIQSH